MPSPIRRDRPGETRLRAAIRRAHRLIRRARLFPRGPQPGSSAARVGRDTAPQRVELLHILTTRCSAEDLRTLCFILGVNHEVLPGDGKVAHARELVAHYDRRQDLDTLTAALHRLRPDLR